MKIALIGVLALIPLSLGCAKTSVLDVDSNTVMISTSAAPACGQQGAQSVASQRAAVETLKRGYDRYIIMGAHADSNVGVVGYTPQVANTYSTGNINAYGNTATYNGQSTTYVTGGQPIISGSHDQKLMIRMFRNGEAGAANALDARGVLGPEWQKAVEKGGKATCY